MTRHLSLAAAETRPSITKYRHMRAEIDLLSGVFTLHFVKLDSTGSNAGAGSVEATLNDTDLAAVIQKISDQAQIEGKIPSGTLGVD